MRGISDILQNVVCILLLIVVKLMRILMCKAKESRVKLHKIRINQ